MSSANSRAVFRATMLLLTFTISEAIHGIIGRGVSYLFMGNREMFLVPAQLAARPGTTLLEAAEPIVALSFMIWAISGLEKAKAPYRIILLLHLLGYNLFRYIWHNL
jgi:apolipoprotein N-acyltransferase